MENETEKRIIAKLVKDYGLDENTVNAIINFQNEAIFKAMEQGREIKLRGFGSFKVITSRVASIEAYKAKMNQVPNSDTNSIFPDVIEPLVTTNRGYLKR